MLLGISLFTGKCVYLGGLHMVIEFFSEAFSLRENLFKITALQMFTKSVIFIRNLLRMGIA